MDGWMDGCMDGCMHACISPLVRFPMCLNVLLLGALPWLTQFVSSHNEISLNVCLSLESLQFFLRKLIKYSLVEIRAL